MTILTDTNSIDCVEVAILNPVNRHKGLFGLDTRLNHNGTVMVTSDKLATVDGVHEQGEVYIYVNSNKGWRLSATLHNPKSTPGGRFGSSVSIDSDGTTIIISAPCDSNSNTTIQGEVFVYELTDGAYLHTNTLHGSSNTGDHFGCSVMINANSTTIAIGANSEMVNGVTNHGRLYIYTKVDNAWMPMDVPIPELTVNDQLGTVVTVSPNGRVIAVTAYGGGFVINQGKVLVYAIANNNNISYIKINNNTAGTWFGCSLTLTGPDDELILGIGVRNGALKNDINSGYVKYVDVTNGKLGLGISICRNGLESGAGYGGSITSNNTATRVAVGIRNDTTYSSGSVIISDVKEGTPCNFNKVLPFDAVDDMGFGTEVALSGDGNTLAITTYSNKVNVSNRGNKIYMYELTGE